MNCLAGELLPRSQRKGSPGPRPNPLGNCRRPAPSPLRKTRARATFLPLFGFSTRAGGLKNESHRRTRSAAEVARPCPPRGRAAQHHSNSRQRVDQGGEIEAHLQSDRPRCRGHRVDPRRGRPHRLNHGTGAHVLRDRAQAPRGCADRGRSLGRPRRAGDPRRPLPLHFADAARERLSRSRRRRDDAHVQTRGRRPQAPHRQDPIRDLDRGDALLSQRHLSPHRRHRQGAHAARRGDRRPSPGAVRAAVAGRSQRHAGHHRSAQDRRRGAAPDRGQRGRSHRRAVAGQDPFHHRRHRAHLQAHRWHVSGLCARHSPRQRQGAHGR